MVMIEKEFDFDVLVDRKETASEKWDFLEEVYGSRDLLPLWVADMDFRSPQPIVDALVARAQHGVYGYTGLTQSYYDSVIGWYRRRYGWELKREWFVFTPGVIPAIRSAIKAFTNPGDKVIVQTPVYFPFFESIESNGRTVLENPLRLTDGRYEMDFEDLERKAKDTRARMLILCNPHNPIGRIWTREELSKLGRICLENDLLVVSDEIHSDIRYPGIGFTNFATISDEFADNSITCTSASKTFNLAGLQISNIIVPNERKRQLLSNSIAASGFHLPNAFAATAVEAAYNKCESWFDQLMLYVRDNLEFLKEFVQKNVPDVKVIEPEGTYLVWLDFRKVESDPEKLQNLLLKDAKVALVRGSDFRDGGAGFERINIACPKSILENALNRISSSVKANTH